MGDDVSQLSVDRLFDVMAHKRRRYTLYYLTNKDDGLGHFGELVEGIVDWETPKSNTDTGFDSDHRARVATDLHHAHLPALSDAGLVDYDPRSGAIRYYDREPIRECLKRTSAMDSTGSSRS